MEIAENSERSSNMRYVFIKRLVLSLLFLAPLVIWNYLFMPILFLFGGGFERYFVDFFLIVSIISSLVSAVIFFIVWRKKSFKDAYVYIVLVPAVVFLIFFSWRFYYSSFSSEKWSNNKEIRYLMVDSFFKEHSIKNLNISKIDGLLGKDDSEEWFVNRISADISNNSKSKRIYKIEDCGFIDIWIRYIVIYFDIEGKAVEWNYGDYKERF